MEENGEGEKTEKEEKKEEEEEEAKEEKEKIKQNAEIKQKKKKEHVDSTVLRIQMNAQYFLGSVSIIKWHFNGSVLPESTAAKRKTHK